MSITLENKGGGGGSRPIHRFETLFLCFKPMDISAKIREGGGHTPFSIALKHIFPFFLMAIMAINSQYLAIIGPI